MNTHETFVSLETSRLLKQAGFDWKCNYYYFTQNGNTEAKSDFRHPAQNYNESMATMDSKSFEFEVCSRPTLEVAQGWLREVKNYYVTAEVDCDSIGVFYTTRYIFHDGNKYNASYIWKDDFTRKIFKTYGESLEAGIKKVLKIILDKGE